MYINGIVYGEVIEFTKGDFKGQRGTFRGITGYTAGYGCVCQVLIKDVTREFTSDFFYFVNPKIQEKWDDENYDFRLDA